MFFEWELTVGEDVQGVKIMWPINYCVCYYHSLYLLYFSIGKYLNFVWSEEGSKEANQVYMQDMWQTLQQSRDPD